MDYKSNKNIGKEINKFNLKGSKLDNGNNWKWSLQL
jgi:hypothetical protein